MGVLLIVIVVWVCVGVFVVIVVFVVVVVCCCVVVGCLVVVALSWGGRGGMWLVAVLESLPCAVVWFVPVWCGGMDVLGR